VVDVFNLKEKFEFLENGIDFPIHNSKHLPGVFFCGYNLFSADLFMGNFDSDDRLIIGKFRAKNNHVSFRGILLSIQFFHISDWKII